MREEVYEQEYLPTLGFSMFEYQFADFAKMQRRIRSLSMFWFGWWVKHKDVIPKGEPIIPGRKKKRRG